jgi:hypothetical protein
MKNEEDKKSNHIEDNHYSMIIVIICLNKLNEFQICKNKKRENHLVFYIANHQ